MSKKKKIAIIGSHGLYASYGGWDQLVNNLAERKSDNIEYLIFNSVETNKVINCPPGVKVRHLIFKAAGFQGLFYDFLSIVICFWRVDTLLLLGVQGIPLVVFLSLFKKVKVVANIGGIEWERPKFGFFSKLYLKFCFNLSFRIADVVVLDNNHYKQYLPLNKSTNVVVIPYGGTIDHSLLVNDDLIKKYSFINESFFLSVSRSLADNLLVELCEAFSDTQIRLVLISNFTNSSYGNHILEKYSQSKNITLINGLYFKPELDLVRRMCRAYIHTHTLCGTAPSLVEMIVAQRPIISIENPQNRFSLNGQGCYFSTFGELRNIISRDGDFGQYIVAQDVVNLYHWDKIVIDYESIL